MYLSRERLTQNDKSKFILIKDNLKQSGKDVLDAITALLVKEKNTLNYLAYEKSPNGDHIFNRSENVNVVDAFSDPFSWKSLQAYDVTSSNVISKLLPVTNTIVIDSLSVLVLHNSTSALYRSIHELLKTGGQLVTLLHADAHSVKASQVLEMLATTVLEVLRIDGTDYCLHCRVKFPSGKVTQQDLIFQINDCLEITSIKNMPVPAMAQPVAKQPDPTANLTFNLNLNSMEKETRDKLVLPYVKAKDDDVANVVSAGFNEDDFYDEDDPDDDLDF